MKKSLFKTTAALGLAMSVLAAYADQGSGGKGMDMGNMKMDCGKHMNNMRGVKMDCMGNDSATSTSMSDGEVKAVDKANKSITLKHGPIKSKTVEMGSMTMSFPVQDPALLSGVKVGDKVRFNVENIKEIATLTSLKVQK